MKIISLNIRGLGAVNKKEWVKELCKREKPDIIGIQETKMKDVSKQLVSKLWGIEDGDFVFVPATGRSGGLLLIWNTRNLKCEFVVKEDN